MPDFFYHLVERRCVATMITLVRGEVKKISTRSGKFLLFSIQMVLKSATVCFVLFRLTDDASLSVPVI